MASARTAAIRTSGPAASSPTGRSTAPSTAGAPRGASFPSSSSAIDRTSPRGSARRCATKDAAAASPAEQCAVSACTAAARTCLRPDVSC